jgi:two-component system response regulator DevR
VPNTVLVVDDDAQFRGVAMRILRASGFAIAGEAGDCATARDAVLVLRPQAILVDARLPDGEGLEMALEFQTLPWAPRVVLTSSDDDVAEQVQSLDGDGALPFVPKADLPSAPLRELLGDE